MNSYNCKYIYRYYKKQGGKLSYRKYKVIIAEHNKLIMEEIIKGFHYEIPNNIGILKILQIKRKFTLTDNGTVRASVNWGESLKLKQRLLDEGKTIYECEKNKFNEIVSDNGGEKWLIYYTDKYFNQIKLLSNLFLHNMIHYNFTPTWSNVKLLATIDSEDFELAIKPQNKNGTNRNNFLKKLIAEGKFNVRDKQQQLDS